ncbi:chlorohydrolase family protein [Nitratireductor sp. GZWM139]|uniref:chlorohydrolase family protein n=1 Tax=Nitratireductor sp. GZWM139 TaxID=2950541 RepID=UPI0024BEFE6A|nr:chlorohydrolase family protein [Nitratireductor sp. GZWM139]MDJ1466123.1 chlorohydrolase family protein [Nitratireductor sp. GZWM139]
MPQMQRNAVRAGHVIAFQDGEHRHLRDGIVVWQGNEIIHVGKEFDGELHAVRDAPGMIVTPGLINTHAHLSESPLDKSFVEDRGPRQFYLSGLIEFLPARDGAITQEGRQASIAFSALELVRTGTTTIMEIGAFGDAVIDVAERSGLRAYVAQSYRSGRWYTDDGRSVKYQWFEDDGRAAFDAAAAFCEANEGRADDRIRTFLSPAQVDTVSGELLKRSRAAATDLRVPLALHTSQSVPEFTEIIRRHGKSPIEWLHEIGFLGRDVILGHAIIVGGTSWANFHADDIGILADTGTNVAHAVWVFARRGIAMESFSKYLARGVNMTIATDTCPQSMIEAMRWTAVVSKIMDRRTEVATARDVFNAATLGGAKALGRDDLGRIAKGAKADMLLWDKAGISMAPVRDPIRNIVYSAQSEDLHSSIIDGRWVMRDRQVEGFDPHALAGRLQNAAEQMWGGMQKGDWAGRNIDELSPESFPEFRP